MILKETPGNPGSVHGRLSRPHLHQSDASSAAECAGGGEAVGALLVVTQDKSVIAGFAVSMDADTLIIAIDSPHDAFALLQGSPRSLVALDVESMENGSMTLLTMLSLHRLPCKVIIVNSTPRLPAWVDLVNTNTPLCGMIVKPIDAALTRLQCYRAHERNAGQSDSIVPISRRTTNALNFISRHYREQLTIAIVGRAVGISRSCLARLVRNEMNMTVSGLIERVRIAVVAYLLQNGENKLEQIADLTGFCEGSHVSRAFLRCTGRRPRDHCVSRDCRASVLPTPYRLLSRAAKMAGELGASAIDRRLEESTSEPHST